AIKSIAPGRVVTGPGAGLAEIDKATRAHSSQELRMSPSTYNTASIGGFVAGGSGGVGATRPSGSSRRRPTRLPRSRRSRQYCRSRATCAIPAPNAPALPC
ncbi:FAD-binding protein, partial [bacterium M00.F.Ca.ET.177.01.1.1]